MSLHNHVALVLELGGISTRFYGGAGVFTPDPPYVGLNCIDVETLSSFVYEWPKFGGVGAPVSAGFALVDRGGAVADLFTRTLDGSLSFPLQESLAAESGTATVTVGGDISAMPAAGYFWIGQEAFHYTARDSGTGVFTLDPSDGRGALGSLIADHVVNSEPKKSYQPLVINYPVVWTRRKAVLYLHTVEADGTINATPDRELLRGFVAEEPRETSPGVWALSLTSEIAKLDRQIGAALEQTTLVDGWHYVSDFRAHSMMFGEYLPEGGLSDTLHIGDNYNIGDPNVTFEPSVFNHETVFGTARGNYPGDPEQGVLRVRDDSIADFATLTVDGYPDNSHGSVADTDMPNLVAGWATPKLESAPIVAFIVASLGNGLHRWPQAAIDLFNERFNCTLDPAGEFNFIDAALSQDGTRLRVVDAQFASIVAPWFNGDLDKMARLLNVQQYARPRYLWYPWLRYAENDPIDANDAGSRAAPGTPGLENRNFAKMYRSDRVVPEVAFTPPATAFWQPGQRNIIVRDDVLLSTGGSLRIVRTNGTFQVMAFDEVTPINDPGGNPLGYLVSFSDRTLDDETLEPFGDWIDLETGAPEKTTVQPYIQFFGEDPRRLILQILLSGRSVGYPDSNYSTLPAQFGIGVDAAAVDIPGILGFPVPEGMRRLSFYQVKPLSARKVLTGILQAMGAALVQIPVDGVDKITLVRPRHVNGSKVDATIEDRDFAINARPLQGRQADRQAVWRIHTNYVPAENRWANVTTFRDKDVADLQDGDWGQEYDIEIRGLDVDDPAELIGLYKSLRARFALEKLVYEGGVLWDVGRTLHIGQVVNVSLDRIRDTDTSEGLTNVNMQVDKLELNPVTLQCKVRLLYDSRKFGGFAPEARVESVLDANRVILSTNVYSSPEKPDHEWLIGGTELPGTGVAVRTVHPGNEESNADKTITAYDWATGEVTITGHGLIEGDRVEPRDFDNAPAMHVAFTYLAESGTLGAAEIPGYRYS